MTNMIRFYLLFLQFLHCATGIFFHERSFVTLKAEPGSQKTFGFSLAYQRKLNTLVTGAPHSSHTGKVFNCPLDEVLSNKTIYCKEANIHVDKLAPYDTDYAPNVNLNLGYSVSANDDYFFTCAPLWSGVVQMYEGLYLNRSVGTCFMYNDTAYRYKSFMETQGDEIVPSRILGGNGWRSLIDDDWLIIAKVAAPPDVTYARADDALAPVESIVNTAVSMRKVHAEHLSSYRNVGFSITAGKFFSKQNVYAISGLKDVTNKGAIHFITPRKLKGGVRKLYLYQTAQGYVAINDTGPSGSMFGASMCSAMLNADERAELVVGAPAWSDRQEGGFETGAVHIYLGGTPFLKESDVMRRQRVILGNKDGSRFGSAVVANDLDGDNYSELFVSAPYEGTGVLYIFSGYEINKRLIMSDKQLSITQFTRTQRIQNDQFRSFGYSLQVINDIDGNGCNELAIGAPKSENIMILRCVPSVNVTLEATHVGEKLKLQDQSFIIRVCVSVKGFENRTLPFTLTNEVEGNGVYIENDNQTTVNIDVFAIDGEAKNCTDVTVKLVDFEEGEYVFQTKVDMDEKKISNSDNFDVSWAQISPYSELKARAELSRRCKDSDCDPVLTMDWLWSGGNITNGSSYELGSSDSLTATLLVTNVGHSAWEACALVSVSGATVAQFGCVDEAGQYKCLLPKGLKRNAMYNINIKLNMSQPTNFDEEIEVAVTLRDYCENPKTSIDKYGYMKLDLKTQDIILTGSSHDQNISDTIIQDQKDSTQIRDAHEYWVENKGKIIWTSIIAEVVVYKKPFINSSTVANWHSEDHFNITVFTYKFDLQPGVKKKIIVSIDIIKDKILQNLDRNKLTIQSKFILQLNPTSEVLEKSLNSTITLKKERNFGQNKNLIIFLAILVAFMVLAVIIFILIKMQFFKNPEKEKLEVLQEHVRRMSEATQPRPISVVSEGLGGLDMEVGDDEDDTFKVS